MWREQHTRRGVRGGNISHVVAGQYLAELYEV